MKPLNQWTSAEVIEFVKRVDKKTWVMIGSGVAASLLILVFFCDPGLD